MRAPLLLVSLAAAACVHAPAPGIAVNRRDPAFELPALAGARVAVWPVAAASLDPAVAPLVTQAYGSENGFLDALGRTVSDRIVRPDGPPSLRSDEVVARLGAADDTRPLLDSRRLLGAPESRFSAPPPELANLGSVPALEGIRYAVLLPGVTVDRRARASLHAAVVDLGRGAVVWEGDLLAYGALDAAGMKRIAEGVGVAVAEGLSAGEERAPPRHPSRCKSNWDCARAVCIDGVCQ